MKDRACILVVEDNPSNRLLVVTVLQRAGYRVLTAETGQQAVDLARAQKPALILMDVALPGMDGLAATRILKADEETRDIPVVVLTAHAMRGDEGRARAAGCDGYVTKPIDTRGIAESIAQVLEDQQRR